MPFEVGSRVFSCSNNTLGYVVGTHQTRTQTLYKVGLPSGISILPETDLLIIPDAYGKLYSGDFDPAQELALKTCAAWLRARYISGEMCSLGSARVQLLPHQVFVAHRACQSVITRMLLADEVGLGKTIEAGLILKELKARGLVKRTLVVAPASLVNQWLYELESKFNERFVKYDSIRIRVLEHDHPGQNIWELNDQVVVSLQLSRSNIYREAIAQADWDLVIFDEAHHLRRYLEGSSTHSYRLAEKLSQTSGSLLLLTATPVQLHSFELYSLVELLDPAIFPDYETFELYRSRIIRLANRIVTMLDRGKGDVLVHRAVAEILELVEQMLTQSRGLRFIKLIGFLIKFSNGFLNSPATGNDLNPTRLLVKALSVMLKLCQNNESNETSYQVTELLKELEDNKSNEASQFVQWVLNVAKNESESKLVQKARVCQFIDDDYEIAATLAEKYGLDIQTIIANRWVRLLAKEMDRLPSTEKEIVNSLLSFLELVAEKMENLSLETSASERVSLIEKVVRSHRLSKVMVRNRRRQVLDVGYGRKAAVVNVRLSAVEQEIYQKVWEYVLDYYGLAERHSDQAGKFVMVTFQRLLASSFQALAEALKRRKERLLEEGFRRSISEGELSELGDTLESIKEIEEVHEDPYDNLEISKIEEVLRLFEKYRDPESKVGELEKLLEHHSGEKVLVYVQFIETQKYLYDFLSRKFKVVLFNGRMDSEAKDLAVAKFRDEATVMISTEAGGEGRNLQFCNIIVNFDLPWNPMKIEQRIGRIDRIGQTKDVLIYNFALEGTIEARILEVLQNRIRIFEESIGSLDPILGEKVEQEVARLIMTSPDQVDNWAADLEVRVRQAKEAEERLQDLIMDRSSFRMDKVHEVLGNAVDSEAFAYAESLVVKFLQRYPAAEVEPLAERTWRLRLPEAFIQEAQKLVGRDLREYTETKAVFEPQEAGKHEECEFLAFGHPLFDSIVEYCRTPHFIRPHKGRPDLVPFGLAAAFCISSPEYTGKRGWLFLFEARAKGGICQYVKVVPLFVSENGEVDRRIADHILHQLCHHTFEEYEEHIEVRERIPCSTLPTCYEEAKQVFQDLVEQMGREWNAQNERLAEEELNRIDRCYRHLIARAHADLERERANLEQVRRTAVTEQQRRILPALEGKVRSVERKIREMRQEWESKRESVTSRVNVTVESGGEPICAAYVEVVG